VANFVSVATSVAELAHGEKSRTQSLTQSLIHPAYLLPREPKLSLRNKVQDRLRYNVAQLNSNVSVHSFWNYGRSLGLYSSVLAKK